MRRSLAGTFLSSFLLLLMPLGVLNQTERGSIGGVVTDSTGAVVWCYGDRHKPCHQIEPDSYY